MGIPYPGFHVLYVRALNERGDWSQTLRRTFYKVSVCLSGDCVKINELKFRFKGGQGDSQEFVIPFNPAFSSLDDIIQIDIGGLNLDDYDLLCAIAVATNG